MGIGEKPKIKESKSYAYLRYSGLAFQMAAVVFFAIWAGKKLDLYLETEKPYFTILLVLVFFSAFLYKLYLDLVKTKK
ncbi:MAG: AtpZ/AtpI family protein [Saprospiraceae bacterium]|nr:AtpZ/AtpI family protein [Saprospiraceae bacterium]